MSEQQGAAASAWRTISRLCPGDDGIHIGRLLVVGLLALGLVACGGESAGGDTSTGETSGERTVELTMLDEMKFVPATIAVKPGQTVMVKLTNKGLIAHDFSTRGLPQDVKVVVQSGKQRTATFTAPPQPGAYVFACTQPGHEEAGMKGVIRVR